MNNYIERLAHNCGVGEFSDSTVIEFIKDALYHFGQQCFEAGQHQFWDDGGSGGLEFSYNSYNDYLKDLKQ